MTDPEIVRQKLARFLAEPAPEHLAYIEGDGDLFKSGVVDSFRIVELVKFIEDEFGGAVDFEEIQEKDFSNLTMLGELVRRLGG